MSEAVTGHILDLLDRASVLEIRDHQAPLFREAVRLADSIRDPDLQFRARMELMWSGEPDELITAMAWCLAHLEADRERFDPYARTLLWRFKWVVGQSPELPQVSRAQIDAMLDQFESLCTRYHHSARACIAVRWQVAIDMGDHQQAEESFLQLSRMPRDQLSDCLACERNTRTTYWRLLGDEKRSVKEMRTIVGGHLRCASIPHNTYGNLLRPLTLRGELEEAQVCHRTGYRLVRGDAHFFSAISDHIAFLAHIGNQRRGMELFERYLPKILETRSPFDQFNYFAAGAALMAQLQSKTDRPRKLRLPREFELHNPEDRYRPSELEAWFTQQYQVIAARFDQRNGNDHKSRIELGWLRY